MACRLCVIYVREDSYSNIQAVITQFIWTTWTSLSAVQERPLTHWGRVTHICVSKLTIIASDNGLSPGRRQAIIWTNDGILLIGPVGTNFNEILIEIHTFQFKKMHLKMSSTKWRPFCQIIQSLHLIFSKWDTETILDVLDIWERYHIYV